MLRKIMHNDGLYAALRFQPLLSCRLSKTKDCKHTQHCLFAIKERHPAYKKYHSAFCNGSWKWSSCR